MGELRLNTTIAFKTTHCFVCGCIIALERSHYDARLSDHKSFYCPNGHGQHFIGETAEQRLQKQLDRARKEKEWAEQATAKERAEAAKLQRKVARLEKRASVGVCPCCKRTFKQLARHMNAKHPGFVKKNKATK